MVRQQEETRSTDQLILLYLAEIPENLQNQDSLSYWSRTGLCIRTLVGWLQRVRDAANKQRRRSIGVGVGN